MTSDYCVAVHALVYLNHKAKVLSSEELAENICTNPARVRKVMAKLKKAGFVKTKEGSEGGYLFDQDADRVTLDQIAQALEIRFVDTAWKSGDTDMKCLVASGMAGLMDEIFDDLNEQCRKRLKEITIGTLDHRIFGNQNKER
ncbi:transcriptional regulator [Clostridium sp. AF18-27]|uniref:Rrf2 family protein n=1 Tax=Enterocloster lavalensis TaxID=460384 RepID=A0A1I0EY53_9FIRM|nr:MULTISPECIES: Rrf2 family transcriptional regulator [Enterocloster]MBS5607722.1 Rrf2 family transcriptional regulator [Enterocloster asparagiformis]RHR55997.1 transcriptional regulator [Clostridium sp. AF18-27]MCB6341659.1 Rrf2 family transcriptional regulator [Enterocloster lavalensis]MDR3758099.1 Rrf2 family transcriptional regulator [Enterocloster sp.]SET50461.1 Rrf2 family protein [Enterocloster lavalensis]